MPLLLVLLFLHLAGHARAQDAARPDGYGYNGDWRWVDDAQRGADPLHVHDDLLHKDGGAACVVRLSSNEHQVVISND